MPENRRATTFFGVLAIWSLCLGMAASQPPSPSPTELSQPNQSEATPSQQQPSDNVSNSSQPPLAQAPARNNAAPIAAQKASSHEDKTSNEWWLMVWTAVLAVITGILAVIAGIQAGFFWWQLGYMRKGVHDAAVAARAASRSAVATVAQAKIARDTLTNVQRPYVYVFGVGRITTSDVVPAVTPYLEYSVANYGQTPAVIQSIGAGFFSGVTPEIPIRVDDDHPLVVSPIMPPGDKRTELRELLPEAFIDEDLGIIVDLATSTTHPLPKLVENEDLFFRVVINYRGPFGDDCETSATWIYRRAVSRFVQLNQQEYTYQT